MLVYVSRTGTAVPVNKMTKFSRHSRPLGKLMESRKSDWLRLYGASSGPTCNKLSPLDGRGIAAPEEAGIHIAVAVGEVEEADEDVCDPDNVLFANIG